MVKVVVKCHDGQEYVTEVEKFDPVAIMNDLENSEKQYIVVGDVVVHRTNVSRIYKAE